MESSQILGSREECSGTRGSESGWTSYIASPIQQQNDDDDDNDNEDEDDEHITCEKGYYRKGNYGTDDGESDDSMASDASSGPRYLELPNNERNIVICSSKEKLQKQVKQKDHGVRSRAEKQDSVIKANSAASRVRGRDKVRKYR